MNGDGFVYFLACANKRFVKIGYSRNPRQRLCSLVGTLAPSLAEFRLIGMVPGGRTAEADLHSRFAGVRDNGEWFRFSAEIREYIAAANVISRHGLRALNAEMAARRSVGRPPVLMPCGWCRKKMPLGELRAHATVCPKRPVKAQ